MNLTAESGFDIQQLRDFTLGNRQLMADILWALIDDASRQAGLLDAAMRDRDGQRICRHARQSARACMNVGAGAAAESLRAIERAASSADFAGCRAALGNLRAQIETLRSEVGRL